MFRKLLALALLLVCCAVVRADEEPLSARRARVEGLSAAEKDELRQKEERFDSLPEAERERLRKLHAELSNCDDADKLRGVLERYHAWLATLSSGERAKLLDMPAKERIAHMKELMKQQEEKRFRDIARLKPEDRGTIVEWLEAFAERNKEAILEITPQQFRPNDKDPRYRRALVFNLLRQWGMEEEKAPRPMPEDIQELLGKLSADAQKAYASRNEADKKRLTAEWLRGAVWNRDWTPVSEEALREFYTKELNDAERETLENLPGDAAKARLRELYYRRHAPRGWSPGQRGGQGGPREDGGGKRGGRGRDDNRRDGDRREGEQRRPSETEA